MTARTKPPVDTYSAIADATRCRIVELLSARPMPVHTLADAFSISRPAISRHLRVLKQAGLVSEVKKGRENLYALRPAKLAKAIAWLEIFGTTPASKTAASVETVAEKALETAPVALAAAAPEPVPIVVTAPKEPEQTPEPVVPKPAARKKPEPVNQMGFDF